MKLRLLAPFTEITVDGTYHDSPYIENDVIDATRIDALCHDLGCEEVVVTFNCPILDQQVEGTIFFHRLAPVHPQDNPRVLVYFQGKLLISQSE